MTVQMCLKICHSKGFAYAGLEWQIECYCGNEPENGFEWAWPEKCDDRCAGDSNQVCGGSNAMSIWSVPPSNLDGICIYNSPATNSILTEFGINGDKNLTIENCKETCSGTNFSGCSYFTFVLFLS